MTDERRLLKDMVTRWSSNDYAAAPAEAWMTMASLGLLALPFAEHDGGLGGGPVEIAIIAEALGRSLVLEPFVATVVIAGAALHRGGSEPQKAAFIPRIVDGSIIIAFAHGEAGQQLPAEIATTTARDGDGFSLTGVKSVVSDARRATHLLVSARHGDLQGLSLFLIDKDRPGMSLRNYPTIDGGEASDIVLDNVPVAADRLIGEAGTAGELIEDIVNEAIVAHCAEAVGVIRTMHEMALDYAKVRKQFGRPIGSFQVIQHRLVDMLVECEQASAMTAMIAGRLYDLHGAERTAAVSALKCFVGKALRTIGQAAVQLHGAMGVTEELPLSRYFKRAMVLDALFGDTSGQLDRYMAASGLRQGAR
jgi:alkylation response protein AidB-like acyl-CoA dehydrogenase